MSEVALLSEGARGAGAQPGQPQPDTDQTFRLQGYLAHKKPRPLGPPCMVLQQGPKGARFLMSEVALLSEAARGAARSTPTLQGYLAHKKPPSPRTLE